MIYVGPLQVNEELVQRAHTMLGDAEQMEQVLAMLRAEGQDKIGSMKVLVRANEMNLGEAKRIVHFSGTWADQRLMDDELHASMIDALEAPAKPEREPRVA